MVVYGQDKLDEISLSAPTSICEIEEGTLRRYTITPEQFGMRRCRKEELMGGTPQDNAQITLSILQGEKGARRDAAVLNAAAALYVAGRAASLSLIHIYRHGEPEDHRCPRHPCGRKRSGRDCGIRGPVGIRSHHAR